MAQRELAEQEGRVPRYSGKCYNLSKEERQAKIDAGIPYSIRFHVEPGKRIEIEDIIRGQVTFQTDDIGDFVIVKSNGIPTYNFQVVIDDVEMEITHVIRAEEHLSNTPRQVLVYEALGKPVPAFAHLPIVLDEHRKKLSKRDPNVLPIAAYEKLGYVPQAIINFLALLGWSPGGEEELFSMEELCAKFDLDRVSKSGAVFDVEKLNWMANQYFKALPLSDAALMVSKQMEQEGLRVPPEAPEGWLENVVSLFQDGMTCAHDFIHLAQTFFQTHIEWEEEARILLRDESARAVVEAYLHRSRQAAEWTADASRARFKEIQAELGVKGKQLFMPVRAAVTGQVHGPDLQKTIWLLGRDVVVERLSDALSSTL